MRRDTGADQMPNAAPPKVVDDGTF